MAQTDYSGKMIELIQTHNARYIYRFSMRGYPSKDWELFRAQPTANSTDLRAVVYLWRHRVHTDVVMSYEVMECSSVKNARGYVKGLRRRNMAQQNIMTLKTETDNDQADDETKRPTGEIVDTILTPPDYDAAETVDGKFQGLSISRHNLGFDMRPVTKAGMEAAYIGDLDPTTVLKSALGNPEFNSGTVRLEIGATSVKAGESVPLRLHFDPSKVPYWALILTDSSMGGISKDDGKLYYHTSDKHPGGTVNFYLAWFDMKFRKATAEPIALEIT